jgi:hypothetical protein
MGQPLLHKFLLVYTIDGNLLPEAQSCHTRLLGKYFGQRKTSSGKYVYKVKNIYTFLVNYALLAAQSTLKHLPN